MPLDGGHAVVEINHQVFDLQTQDLDLAGQRLALALFHFPFLLLQVFPGFLEKIKYSHFPVLPFKLAVIVRLSLKFRPPIMTPTIPSMSSSDEGQLDS